MGRIPSDGRADPARNPGLIVKNRPEVAGHTDHKATIESIRLADVRKLSSHILNKLSGVCKKISSTTSIKYLRRIFLASGEYPCKSPTIHPACGTLFLEN